MSRMKSAGAGDGVPSGFGAVIVGRRSTWRNHTCRGCLMASPARRRRGIADSSIADCGLRIADCLPSVLSAAGTAKAEALAKEGGFEPRMDADGRGWTRIVNSQAGIPVPNREAVRPVDASARRPYPHPGNPWQNLPRMSDSDGLAMQGAEIPLGQVVAAGRRRRGASRPQDSLGAQSATCRAKAKRRRVRNRVTARQSLALTWSAIRNPQFPGSRAPASGRPGRRFLAETGAPAARE